MSELDTDLIDSVKGFLDPLEGRRLYETAREACKMGPCLEIGSYCGKSTLYLGWGCRENNGILYSIDHHAGSEEQQPGEEYFDPETFDPKSCAINTFPIFQQTIRKGGLEETVVPIVAKSHVVARMWSTPLSLVFIDGGHSYEAAFTDYSCWAPLIIPGGFLIIHDIFFDPQEGGQAPRRIYELAQSSGLFETLPMTKTLGVLRRRYCQLMPPPGS